MWCFQVFFHKFLLWKHDKEQARAGKPDKRKGKQCDVGSDGDDNNDVIEAGKESQSDTDDACRVLMCVCVCRVCECVDT